jgi:hypothetical protein
MEINLVVEDEAPLFLTTSEEYAVNKIEQEEETRKQDTSKPTLTRLIRKHIEDSGWDVVIEVLNGLACTLLFGTFFFFTYYDRTDPRSRGEQYPAALTLAENILMVYITVDYVVMLLLAEHRVDVIFSADSLVTIFTVLPLALVNGGIVTDEDLIKVTGLLVWRIVCIFQAYRMHKLFAHNQMLLLVFKSVW